MPIDWKTATSDELKEFRRNLNFAEVDSRDLHDLDMMIIDKVSAENAEGLRQEHSFLRLAEKADKTAKQMWPELKDETSEFYKEVDKRLTAAGNALSDPDALRNMANQVGLEKGLVPAGMTPQGNTGLPSTKMGGDKPEDAAPDPGNAFLDRTKRIAAAFENAGVLDMSDKDTRDSIASRASDQEENKDA